MRVKKTFSRFHHSPDFLATDYDFQVPFFSMGPGFNLNKDNGVAVKGYYINFSPSCPPISLNYEPVFLFQQRGSKIFACAPSLLPHLFF